MLVSKKNRVAIYASLFKEGVMCAPKDFAKTVTIETASGNEVEVRNLEIIKLMTSLKSREYVKETFNWRWFYWYLNDEGIEYLRQYLNIPADVVPDTMMKQAPRAGESERRYGRGGGGFDKDKGVGPGGDFKPDFRREGGFGRG